MTAEESREISFRLLDPKDQSPIRLKRINQNTGKEVEWNDIVKGFEYEEDKFVTFTEEELKEIAAETNNQIEIDDFVLIEDINPIYFDQPYYLVPEKGGQKGYALLRDVLERTKKVAIARMVMRTKEYVAAIIPVEGALLLDTLRYQSELKTPEAIPVPDKDVQVSEKEIKFAEQLLKEMSSGWKPEKYKDRYQEKLSEMVEAKVSGEATHTRKGRKGKEAPSKNVVDIVELLQKSIKERGKKPAGTRKSA